MILSINKRGYIKNEGNIKKIQPEYKLILDEIVSETGDGLKNNILSMYIRECKCWTCD